MQTGRREDWEWAYHQFLTLSMPVVRIIIGVLDRPALSIVHNILAVYQTHDLTMVLTVAQMTTFFEHANQMGIPHTTVLQLQSEGITLVSDLVDFNKDSLQQLVDNLRCPGGHVLDPNPQLNLDQPFQLHHLYLVPSPKDISLLHAIW